jgi:hypothetical protein
MSLPRCGAVPSAGSTWGAVWDKGMGAFCLTPDRGEHLPPTRRWGMVPALLLLLLPAGVHGQPPRLSDYAGTVRDLRFAADGKSLAAVSWDDAPRQGPVEVRRWDTATERELSSARITPTLPTAAALAPDGRTLATGGQDVLLWDVRAGKGRAALTGAKHPVRAWDLTVTAGAPGR